MRTEIIPIRTGAADAVLEPGTWQFIALAVLSHDDPGRQVRLSFLAG